MKVSLLTIHFSIYKKILTPMARTNDRKADENNYDYLKIMKIIMLMINNTKITEALMCNESYYCCDIFRHNDMLIL